MSNDAIVKELQTNAFGNEGIANKHCANLSTDTANQIITLIADSIKPQIESEFMERAKASIMKLPARGDMRRMALQALQQEFSTGDTGDGDET